MVRMVVALAPGPTSGAVGQKAPWDILAEGISGTLKYSGFE